MTDKVTTSFEHFAEVYDRLTGDKGDYTHRKTIDPALFEVVGKVRNKVVYDIACGNGYIARKFAREGAKEVWASDISKKFISLATEKYENPKNKIKYFVRDATNFKDIPQNHFDMVVMNMAIHYVKEVDSFLKGISLLLKERGRFIYTTAHPLRRLSLMDAKKDDLWPDLIKRSRRYLGFSEDVIKTNPWTGKEDLKIYHAPISYYINLLCKNKLYVHKMVEPKMDTIVDTLKDQTRIKSPIPGFYAIGAIKISK
jgi:ubiquinone/menaquinone biosynthesis C-methylase UbiE